MTTFVRNSLRSWSKAKWLLKERDRILQEARKESEGIVRDAQGQIATLASESVITKGSCSG